MSPSRLALPVLSALAVLAACGGGGGDGGPSGGTTPPLIASFSPSAGPVGTQVTITGLLFAATPAGNAVRFDGRAATVLSASPQGTSLVAVVPAGATTGRIQVATAGGTATSAADFTVLSGPGSAWTTRLAGPGGPPRGLAWTGARFAAVGGSDPGFQASPDGLAWTVTSRLSSADDVAWDGSLMVAVGGSFWVDTSADGLTWATRTLPAGSGGLNAVARSPGAWVAVGDGGRVVSSPDGITWTSRASGTGARLVDVAWGAGRFVAVGEDGAVTTSADGIGWTAQAAPTTDSFTAVGASAERFAATTFPYAGSQSALLTSPDGAAWTPRLAGAGSFNTIAFAGGRFVGGGFYVSGTSPDGVTWDLGGTVPGILDAVVGVPGGYAAVGSDRNGAGAFFTSTDGLAWSLRAADHDLVAVARRPADGLLVAVGSDVARVSADGGATWTLDWLTPSLAQNYPFLDLAWSPSADAFLAMVQVAANQYVYRSTDGRGWTQVAYVPCYGSLTALPSGRLVAMGTSLAGACVATSDDDGATWTPRTPPAAPPGAAAGWRVAKAFALGSQLVAVGPSGALATSPDGAAWTARASGVTAALRGAAASPTTLVAVGDGGTVLTSPDGASWTPRTSGTTFPLRRVTWTGAEFLAVGASGRLLRSPDGAAWTTLPTPWTSSPNAFALNDLLAIPGGAGALVVVGSGGLVATSP